MELPRDREKRVQRLRVELAGADSPETRTPILASLAKALWQYAPDEARVYLEEVMANATDINDHKSEAAATHMLAEIELRSGNITQCMAYAEQSLRAARASGDERTMSSAYNCLGGVYWEKGDFAKAREFFNEALDVSRKAGALDLEQSALNGLGSLAGLQGNIEEALEYYQRCLELDDQLEDVYCRVLHLNNVGWALEQLGRWEEASASLYRAISLSELYKFEDMRLRSMNQVGEVLLKRDKLEQAVEMLEHALADTRKHEQLTELRQETLCNLGVARFRIGELSGSEEAYGEAMSLAQQSEDRVSQAMLHWRTAELAVAQGRLEDAESHVAEASSIAHSMNLKRELGETFRVRGMLFGEQGDLEGARDCYRRSIQELESLGDGYELARARLQLGRLLAGQDCRTEALGLLNRAVNTFRRLSIVAESEEANRLIFQLEMPSGGAAALIGGLAGLARVGLEPLVFAERGLRLLCEGLGCSAGALVSGGHCLVKEGRPKTTKAVKLCRAGELVVGPDTMLFPVDSDGEPTAVYLERTDGAEPFIPRALPDEVSKRFAEVARKLAALPRASGDETGIPGLRYRGVVSRNPLMVENLKVVSRVAGTPVPVLIRGESGTGKELVARALHESGDRSGRQFVAINCAAVPEGLLEVEFFGVVKGAATGISARKGKFEQADGGTVFLDEIGDMSPPLQSKLLRVLQEHTFEQVGGRNQIKVDVRLVAATNQNLAALMKSGEFRRDLYYRLNTVELVLPPLRERKEDIPDLVRYFVARSNQEFGRGILGASEDAMGALMAYDWPGNVRELQHIVERAVILAQGEAIEVGDLSQELQRLYSSDAGDAGRIRTAKEEAERKAGGQVEKTMLLDCLERSDWNVSEAAKLAGYSRAQFYRLLSKHSISRPK